MNHASSTPVDADARRYLKHHAVLDGARQRAYTYLNQTWLQLNRIITRELGGELRNDNWIEVISSSDEHLVGLRWRSNSLSGGVILEVADVRRWTHVSGDHVVFTISSSQPQTRAYLAECCSDDILENTFQQIGVNISLMKYGPKSSRVFSLALPLQFSDPRQEAQSLIEGIVSLWEIIEGAAQINQQATPRLQHNPKKQDPNFSSPPRYASAAPPLSNPPQQQIPPTTAHQVNRSRNASASSTPFPPTLEPKGIAPVQETPEVRDHLQGAEAELLKDEKFRESLSGMTKEEMIQAIQAQVRQRPGRLIRGGEKKATPVLSDPPRFVPRPLQANEEAGFVHPNPKVNPEAAAEGRVHSPDQTVQSLDLADSPLTADHSQMAVSTSVGIENNQQQYRTETTSNSDIAEPSYFRKLEIEEANTNEQGVVIKAEPANTMMMDQATNLPIQNNIDQSSLGESYQNVVDGEEAVRPETQAVHAVELDAQTLSDLLDRVGLTPWRVNSYGDGAGQILWLKNGAHVDYNPSGEVILGGENQDETRARLHQIGVLI